MLIIVKVKITRIIYDLRVNAYRWAQKSELFGNHFYFEQSVFFK